MPNQRAGLFIPQLFKPSCRTASNHRPGPPPDGRQAINGTDHSALHVKSCRISLCGTCHSRQMVNGAELLFECNNWGVAWKRSAGLRSLRATPPRSPCSPLKPRAGTVRCPVSSRRVGTAPRQDRRSVNPMQQATSARTHGRLCPFRPNHITGACNGIAHSRGTGLRSSVTNSMTRMRQSIFSNAATSDC